jgi:hypothetical protein
MRMPDVYQSHARVYRIPPGSVDKLLAELEGAMDAECKRVRSTGVHVTAGIYLKTPDATTGSGYDFDHIQMARESGDYTDAESLGERTIEIWLDSFPYRDGKFRFGVFVTTTLASLRIDDDVARVEMTGQNGFACNPAVVADVLKRYALLHN